MPTAAEEVKSSWADEVEEVGRDLSSPTEVIENGFKVITEYRRNEDDKKEKIVRTYKIEKRIVSKSIAKRKTWPKYGVAKDDKPGPNPANTIIAEDVFMQFITSREEQDKPDDDALEKLKSMGDKTVKCRACNGDHWTLKCPYKDTGLIGNKIIEEKKPAVPVQEDKSKGKYVAPGLRDGGSKRGESMNARRDDALAIRVSNLSDNTHDADLEELVKPFGKWTKIFVAKDKVTGMCKGFAYVHFRTKEEAAKAIAGLNGHGYDHLILKVEWSKPQPQS
ncbi:hypothetical protein AAG570_004996 [Ranatra chinensis]|uniref:Eukaryotic translation initiation factor 3 subunit G n=1 Tax=Ranatra chinensis TaxID=642074 RepID=A0ABD0YHH0_9HEMI